MEPSVPWTEQAHRGRPTPPGTSPSPRGLPILPGTSPWGTPYAQGEYTFPSHAHRCEKRLWLFARKTLCAKKISTDFFRPLSLI